MRKVEEACFQSYKRLFLANETYIINQEAEEEIFQIFQNKDIETCYKLHDIELAPFMAGAIPKQNNCIYKKVILTLL